MNGAPSRQYRTDNMVTHLTNYSRDEYFLDDGFLRNVSSSSAVLTISTTVDDSSLSAKY